MCYSLGTGQASKTEKEQIFQQEGKVHQTWGKCYEAETSQESSETEKNEAYWGPMCIQKISVFDSDQEPMNSGSSEEGEVWKLGLGKFYDFNNIYSNKKLKQHTESFFI